MDIFPHPASEYYWEYVVALFITLWYAISFVYLYHHIRLQYLKVKIQELMEFLSKFKFTMRVSVWCNELQLLNLAIAFDRDAHHCLLRSVKFLFFFFGTASWNVSHKQGMPFLCHLVCLVCAAYRITQKTAKWQHFEFNIWSHESEARNIVLSITTVQVARSSRLPSS